jgi:signal transduction histidine kinase
MPNRKRGKAMPNILIAEDEKLIALDIQNTLQKLGYKVAGIVDSGEEAVKKTGEWHPDLILMDIVLKGKMDGIQAAGIIRSRWNIPVVYLTSYSDEAILERVRPTEPFGYILKPYQEREIRIVLQIALYKAETEKKLNRYLDQLRNMASCLAETEEGERRRIARELHDQVGQNLTALSINLNIFRGRVGVDQDGQTLQRLEDSQRLIEEVTPKIRDIMADLRPAVLDDYGLLAALRWLGHRFAEHTRIDTKVIGEESNGRLSSTAEVSLFRVAQEALTNISKHAQARQVIIHLKATEEEARLTISDDGVGFDLEKKSAGKERDRWGLIFMQERIKALAGEFSLTTTPGQGTCIVIGIKK